MLVCGTEVLQGSEGMSIQWRKRTLSDTKPALKVEEDSTGEIHHASELARGLTLVVQISSYKRRCGIKLAQDLYHEVPLAAAPGSASSLWSTANSACNGIFSITTSTMPQQKLSA